MGALCSPLDYSTDESTVEYVNKVWGLVVKVAHWRHDLQGSILFQALPSLFASWLPLGEQPSSAMLFYHAVSALEAANHA